MVGGVIELIEFIRCFLSGVIRKEIQSKQNDFFVGTAIKRMYLNASVMEYKDEDMDSYETARRITTVLLLCILCMICWEGFLGCLSKTNIWNPCRRNRVYEPSRNENDVEVNEDKDEEFEVEVELP